MKFWDSSAIVPLLVREVSTRHLQGLYREDPVLLVWALTPAEVISALCRRHREGALTAGGLQESLDRLGSLRADWSETQDIVPVRDRAERILRVHPLPAADAFQLGAALILTEERPQGFPFVTLDRRLAEAAAREGFRAEGAGR